MIQVLLWLLVIGCFLLSFIGLIYPLIPGVVFLWAGFLVYQFFITSNSLPLLFWLTALIFTVLLVVADVFVNRYFVKRFGGSLPGERAALISVIVGSFIFPPFGLILLPIIAVVIVERLQNRTMKEASLAALGSFIGFLTSTIAKFIMLLLMIIIFFIFTI